MDDDASQRPSGPAASRDTSAGASHDRPAGATSASEGLGSRLFDLSFEYRVTPRIIPALYLLLIVAAAMVALVIVAAGLTSGSVFLAAAALVFGPMVFLTLVLLARIALETAAAVARMDRNVAYLARRASPHD